MGSFLMKHGVQQQQQQQQQLLLLLLLLAHVSQDHVTSGRSLSVSGQVVRAALLQQNVQIFTFTLFADM